MQLQLVGFPTSLFVFSMRSLNDVYIPADNSANVVEYPSIIKLRYQKNDADNGKLIATFEKGTIILSATSIYGETFAPIDNPIPYSLDPYERCSYSSSLFFSEDGTTLYYVNNPPCYESTYKITVAKIRISE